MRMSSRERPPAASRGGGKGARLAIPRAPPLGLLGALICAKPKAEMCSGTGPCRAHGGAVQEPQAVCILQEQLAMLSAPKSPGALPPWLSPRSLGKTQPKGVSGCALKRSAAAWRRLAARTLANKFAEVFNGATLPHQFIGRYAAPRRRLGGTVLSLNVQSAEVDSPSRRAAAAQQQEGELLLRCSRGLMQEH